MHPERPGRLFLGLSQVVLVPVSHMANCQCIHPPINLLLDALAYVLSLGRGAGEHVPC